MKKFLKIDFEMIRLIALAIGLGLFVVSIALYILTSFIDSPSCFINQQSLDCQMHKLEVCIDKEQLTKEECLLLIK